MHEINPEMDVGKNTIPVDGRFDRDDLLHLLVHSIKDYSIYLIDLQGNILTWNEGAKRIKGYTAEQIIGKPYEQFFTLEDQTAGKPKKLLASAARNGSVHDEGWRVRNGGSRFWASATLTALYDQTSGLLRGYAKVTHDETQKHEDAESLKQSEERFRLSVSALREQAFYMVSPEGLVESWNPGAELIKGYTADEVVGKHFKIFFSEEDQTKGKPQRELEIAKIMGSFEEQGWRVRKDGSRFWAAIVVTAVRNPNGDLRGFAKVTRDETQRHEADVALQAALVRAREAEYKLRDRAEDLEKRVAERTEQLVVQTEALKRSNEELEHFAYIASHDLKEPLRMIISYLELLRIRYGRTFEAHANMYLTTIEETAKRMNELIEAVLEYSFADVSTELLEMPLREIVDAALANLQQAIAESNAHIVIADLPELRVNRVHLIRVFQNLIGNAMKFRAERPLAISIEAISDDLQWIISVTDNGIGIDPAYHGKLFKVFQRLHSRDAYAGSGIGLASCKKIIERHGGRIWIESTVGAGSSFRFTLPRTL